MVSDWHSFLLLFCSLCPCLTRFRCGFQSIRDVPPQWGVPMGFNSSGLSSPWQSLPLSAEVSYKKPLLAWGQEILWLCDLHSTWSSSTSPSVPSSHLPPAMVSVCFFLTLMPASISWVGWSWGGASSSAWLQGWHSVYCHPVQRCLGSAVTGMWQVVASSCTAPHCRPFLCLEIFGNARMLCKKEYLHIYAPMLCVCKKICMLAFLLCGYQAQIFILFGALQGHAISFTVTCYFLTDGDAATVMCKMIFMYLLPRKGKKKKNQERRERKLCLIRLKSEQDCFW